MSILRACSSALATALEGGIQLAAADIVAVTLIGGTQYLWTSWNQNLVVSGYTYTCRDPWVTCGRSNYTNTMEVPGLEVVIRAKNDVANWKTLAVQGLFDGATVLRSIVFMPLASPGDTTTYGTIPLFYGVVGKSQIIGTEITLSVKGGNNMLDVPAPRNTYQPGCLHTFCDTGCTLNRASFTASFVTGDGVSRGYPPPSTTYIPWPSLPFAPGKYISGTLTMTSGVASGEARSIVNSDAGGLTLADPLSAVPSAGDTFTGFQGCDKTINTCNVTYSNIINFRGFPFIPPQPTMATGSY
jgi:uncharacterized phage protein (TIGR02218 family)